MRSYSRRELYAAGEFLGESVTRKEGGRIIYGGGGGGPSGPTQSTTVTSNIPEYAKPYVTNMFEATQQQLFTGTKTPEGGFNITGFRNFAIFFVFHDTLLTPSTNMAKGIYVHSLCEYGQQIEYVNI